MIFNYFLGDDYLPNIILVLAGFHQRQGILLLVNSE